jgi:alpha-N-arabinofuranosidase
MRIKVSLLALILLIFNITVRSQNTVDLLVSDTSGPQISRFIYGQFVEHLGTCIYEGIWDEKDNKFRMEVVDALKKLKIPLLRWPGGCFADQYHWRDGIGPRDQRKKTVNTPWGMVTERNSFGTHEFMDLCSLLGCEPYVAGNVGTGTPEEMESWLEYLNYPGESTMTDLRKQNGRKDSWNVTFWGVGNESWGCGGAMTPDYYAQLYRRYARFCRRFNGQPMKLIACGAESDDYNWTEVVMKNILLRSCWGIGMHYYAYPGDKDFKDASATNFGEAAYFRGLLSSLKMEELITKHLIIMDKYDPQHKVNLVVDEWGISTDSEPGTDPVYHHQQSSLRDALVAATTLNIFHSHADRIKMANLAQAVNVVQALILTEGDKMLRTPTYHIFDMYKVHQDARLLVLKFNSPDYVFGKEKIPALNASASRDSLGAVHISLVNIDANKSITVRTSLRDLPSKSIQGQILTSEKVNDYNSFDQPDRVHLTDFKGAHKEGNELVVTLPAKSAVTLELK